MQYVQMSYNFREKVSQILAAHALLIFIKQESVIHYIVYQHIKQQYMLISIIFLWYFPPLKTTKQL